MLEFFAEHSRNINYGQFDRIIWIVLDSVGIGPLPDAADYGDTGRTTLATSPNTAPCEFPRS